MGMDQASKLRELIGKPQIKHGPERDPEQVPSATGSRIIAVTSGKGGVGKTSLVVNVAVLLAKMGKRVVVFDADMGLANAEVLLGLNPRYTLYEVISGEKTLDEVMLRGPYNLHIISGGSGLQELVDLDDTQLNTLLSTFASLEEKTDFVLVDTGAGISKNVLGFVAASREVVVVVTPEPASLTDAYALIKVLAKFKTHTEVNLVVNRATGEREAMFTANKMKTVAAKFLNISVKNIGYVIEDKVIRQASKAQVPFVLMKPGATASCNVANITGAIVNKCEHTPDRGMITFIGKLVRLFR
ncbi:MAG TPA: MinD/ParA family protein [Clostridia bacterium]|nr:MinD/ParA family protein [Clostridia bacterium]